MGYQTALTIQLTQAGRLRTISTGYSSACVAVFLGSFNGDLLSENNADVPAIKLKTHGRAFLHTCALMPHAQPLRCTDIMGVSGAAGLTNETETTV